MRVFPLWADYLELGDVALRGINFRLHDDPQHYRRAVEQIRRDPLCLGALVTTHKLDVYQASRDLFDETDEFAQRMHEVSSISKKDGRLIGHALDPVNSGLVLESMLGAEYWSRTGAEVLICGAGGASVATSWYLLQEKHGSNRPRRIVMTDRSQHRLEEAARLHRSMKVTVPVEYSLVDTTQQTDALLAQLAPKSLVINATGLGKDAPGSPLSDSAIWPEDGIAWEFNYRGDLVFLQQARSQQATRRLQVFDGWEYFIYGWTSVMSEVFHFPTPTGQQLDDLSRIARAVR